MIMMMIIIIIIKTMSEVFYVPVVSIVGCKGFSLYLLQFIMLCFRRVKNSKSLEKIKLTC